MLGPRATLAVFFFDGSCMCAVRNSQCYAHERSIAQNRRNSTLTVQILRSVLLFPVLGAQLIVQKAD